jgi:hypothetical protein
MKLSNKQYDQLKFVALVLLPALSTLYVTLGSLWGLPQVEKVVGTLVALDTLLGVLLKSSSSNYEGDGDLIVATTTEGDKGLSVDLNTPPAVLETKNQVVFNVRPQTLADVEQVEKDQQL